MLSYVFFAAAAVWVAVYVFRTYVSPLLKKSGVSVPTSVDNVAVKIDDYADLTAGMSACFALSAIAKKRGDTALADQVKNVRITLATILG
jgi:hypothetical protein